MLDGRQIAVIAALTNGDSSAAEELVAATEPGEPWEVAVTACLRALCNRYGAGLNQPHTLADTFLTIPSQHGTIAFEVRLGLTIINVIGASPAAGRVMPELHRRITAAADGAAAKETQADPLFTTLSTQDETHRAQDLIEACGLDSPTLPAPLHQELQDAVRISDRLIRDLSP
ncbi:hypothetical protein [Streptomyces sp. IGB124]|uniref:hypothetical protein n=1 Tax=Streptomyces sp. IGB124 TaxID=1519485 RepID=UPI000B18D69C|nr:hypothetical protein [Streptomyces sp. IGB124]